MSTRRSAVAAGAAAGLVAALVMMAFPAVAAVGDSLILGQSNSGGNKTTSATASVDGPAFKFTNNFGGKKAAARIDTGCGAGDKFDCAPPFATDSSARVLNFNADYLDGMDSSAFQAALGLEVVEQSGQTNPPPDGLEAGLTATCPVGKSAIAGGAVESLYLVVADSYPTSTGWRVEWVETQTSGAANTTVYATCINTDAFDTSSLSAPEVFDE